MEDDLQFIMLSLNNFERFPSYKFHLSEIIVIFAK